MVEVEWAELVGREEMGGGEGGIGHRSVKRMRGWWGELIKLIVQVIYFHSLGRVDDRHFEIPLMHANQMIQKNSI